MLRSPKAMLSLEGEHAYTHMTTHDVNGKERDLGLLSLMTGHEYELEQPSTLDGGLGWRRYHQSFYDFSITKNVFTMMFAALLLFFVFNRVKNVLTKRMKAKPLVGYRASNRSRSLFSFVKK